MINVEDFYGISAYKQGELCGMILDSKEQFYDGVMFNIKEFCGRNGMRGQGIGSEVFKDFQIISNKVKRIWCERNNSFYIKRRFYRTFLS